jgi:molybdate transport system substrate-binding protein
MKTLAVGLSTALAMAYSPAQAASNIRLAVAPSFAAAVTDIVGSFTSYYNVHYGLTYNVALTIAPASVLETKIIAGGTTGPYDLFLSSSVKEPRDLQNHHSTIVSGSLFHYARDRIDYYSPTVDVTGGLPNPPTTDFVIPDPTLDVYGAATAELLGSGWGITTIPGGHVFVRPSAGSTQAAIDGGTYASGFVAKSQICRFLSGVEVYPDGSYHHEYRPRDGYTAIRLGGIAIALTRTTDQQQELDDFIAFLTGTTDTHSVVPPNGQNIIKSYCFRLPATP